MNKQRAPWATVSAAALAAAILAILSTTAATQQMPLPPPSPLQRRHHPLPPPVLLPLAVSVKSIAVSALIRDGVAETSVSHVFANQGSAPAEGDFVFPIPAGASVSSFAMYDGEKKLEALLLDKNEATMAYEEIVRRRRDPALLTFQGRAALRARVFPIAPGSERRLTLKLVTVLPRENDAKKYAWTLAGPFLPGGAGRPEVSVRVEVTSTNGAIGNVYSPTHDVAVRRDSDRRRVVATWASTSKNSDNDEFALFVAPQGGASPVALSVLTYNAALPQVASLGGGVEQSGYFLVVASPTLADPGKAALSRRVVYVMDRSGSMAGKKIEQARGALRIALGRLRPQDRFNLLTFSDRVEPFAPAPLAASPDNLKRALTFVDDIVADGGTNIAGALKAGLAQFPEKASNNTLLFFTDGLPTVGDTNRDRIVRDAMVQNDKKTRTFVFGVGYDVDVPFLDRVGQGLRGDADYVRPDEDIEVKVSRFVAKTAAPVLENLKLSIAGARAGEVYPRPGDLPDLFAGSQLVLVGRYTGASGAAATITLTGEANNKPQTYTLGATFPAVAKNADFLPRLWATRKIGTLMDEVRLKPGGAAQKEIIDQIIALSREFGVLTPYTALFVPEPGTNVPVPRSPRPVPDRDVFQDRIGGFAAAPAASTGEAAVDASQSARAQRSQNQVGNVFALSAKASRGRREDEARAQRIQNVGSRTFYQVGPVWTDATFDAKKQATLIKIKLYSPAYFALTRRSADLAKWAALGEQVIIAASATQAVQFGPDGRETLTDAEVTALGGPPLRQ